MPGLPAAGSQLPFYIGQRDGTRTGVTGTETILLSLLSPAFPAGLVEGQLGAWKGEERSSIALGTRLRGSGNPLCRCELPHMAPAPGIPV